MLDFVSRLVSAIRAWIVGRLVVYLVPAAPGKLSCPLFRAEGEVLTYKVVFPAIVPGPVAVDHRSLSVAVNGAPVVAMSKNYAPADAGPSLDFSPGDVVVLSLTDVSAAGVASDPSTLSFTAANTLKPATPGALAVELVGETA